MTNIVYRNQRPLLTIEDAGGASLGRCYVAHYYKITSRKKLSREKIYALRAAGLLGFGQEFRINNQCDGSEPPSGHDLVTPVSIDSQGIIVNESPCDYNGNRYEPIKESYYTYHVEDRIDSSD
jgi:hypothetical protein